MKAEADALRVPPEAEPTQPLPETAQPLVPNLNPGTFGPYFTPGSIPPVTSAGFTSTDFDSPLSI